MTIDKLFSPNKEQFDGDQARIDAFTREFSNDERPARMISVVDFESALPKRGDALRNQIWQIRCEDCDPERGGYYWVSLDQCDTPAKALDCIMQLNEKDSSPVVLQSFIDLIERFFGRGALTDE
jgi:hypothetical protein